VPAWTYRQPVAALPRFQLRTFSSTEEPDRSYEAVSEAAADTPAAEAESDANDAEVTSEVSSDATGAIETATGTVDPGNSSPRRFGDDAETASRSVYMGNIYFDITADQLKELCSQYGEVQSVRLMKDVRGFSRG
jgi:nucleolin